MSRARPRSRRALAWLAALVAVLALAVPPAAAHEEREVAAAEEGRFPTYRESGPSVVVCKPDTRRRIQTLPAELRRWNLALLERCEFEHIQPALNWIAANGEPGYRVLVLPGVYREEPSREAREERFGAPLDQPGNAEECKAVVESGEQALSYEQHVTCPHLQNLIAVLGDATPTDDSTACDSNICDLQIEGTGGRPEDVIIDGKFKGFLNGIRADRGDGIYLRNLTAQHFDFNGVYIIETASSAVDSVNGRFNHEYGFLSFQAYTLYENCEGSFNGDSAFYPGASPDNNRNLGLIPLHRDEFVPTTEIRACRGHHNALGHSGTTGNSNYVHHNEFDHNTNGFAHDSLFPGHPGTPQNHALLEDNLFHENNANYYDQTAHEGTCSKPLDERDYEDGNVCPAIPLPVGTGQITAGGNMNWFNRNRSYDNWRAGFYQFWVPAELREEGPDPDAHYRNECGPDGDQQCPFEETSHWNTYTLNHFAENPNGGLVQPNGVDFVWDMEGEGNCWAQSGDTANTSAAGEVTFEPMTGEEPTGMPASFPDCTGARDSYEPGSTNVFAGGCVTYNAESNPDPPGCPWFHTPPAPEGREPGAVTLERLAGKDRIGTSLLAAREAYPDRATTVVLARADSYADALAGAPLAAARRGPLLLNPSAGLDARVAAEIERLGATTVVLLGGTAALSGKVEADLRGLGFASEDIVRIAGADRYDTAVRIARNLPATDALVATGEDWVDALAASGVAAHLERPILLTESARLSPATKAYLEEGDIEAVDIVGGPKAVSEDVEKAMADLLDEVERVAGEDRYGTSLALAEFALQAGADPTELWLTTATNWPDGIAAGASVAVDEGVMFLVGEEVAETPLATWLEEVHPYYDDESSDSVDDVLERVRILGGKAAVGEQVAAHFADTYGAGTGDAKGDRSHGNEVTMGRFSALPGAASGYADVEGYATMERRLDGTTRVRVFVEGLPTAVGTAHPVHVHSEPCGFQPVADNPHYMRDPNGATMEPNEIHPTFSTGDGGVGIGDSTVFHHPDDTSLSVMIHAPDGSKQVCADLR